ncbi:MAG: hypothetical protein LBV16_03085, partial [Elusimicrobiota bacterium]|nr:hypothetical protein [Elusimicrobiota bacterium]
MKNKMKQIAKTISSFVGADPCVCPPLVRMNLPIFQINRLSVSGGGGAGPAAGGGGGVGGVGGW